MAPTATMMAMPTMPILRWWLLGLPLGRWPKPYPLKGRWALKVSAPWASGPTAEGRMRVNSAVGKG
eukprot:3765577-Alexandrium_andersonii.AAC.1